MRVHGKSATHLAVAHQDWLVGLVPIDPLGAIGDGGVEEMGAIMAERVGTEQAARADELDARAQSPEGLTRRRCGSAQDHLARVFRLA
jgi:hypothetical protein